MQVNVSKDDSKSMQGRKIARIEPKKALTGMLSVPFDDDRLKLCLCRSDHDECADDPVAEDTA